MLTNLGNVLDSAHRWIEAYECYREALIVYPQNGTASGNAAQLLNRIAPNDTLGHQTHLIELAQHHAQHAKDNLDTVKELAGELAVATYQILPADIASPSAIPQIDTTSEYETFIARNRLYLAPILDGLAHNRRRWDDVHVRLLIERIETGPEVPPVIAMVNELKADYLVARDLLYQGLKNPPANDDTGRYLDTLDYASYGKQSSRLVLAQRSSLDLLDKIAVAINEHFNLAMLSDRVTFINIWRERPAADNWRPRLRQILEVGNPGLIALSDIAADLLEKGPHEEPPLLSAERAARNTGTHRFTVLHDMTAGAYRASKAIDHHDLRAFQKMSLRTLKLARAALLYFLEAIFFDSAANRDASVASTPLLLRSHHYIRGKQ